MMNAEHPVYIVSKGRWERPLTARALEVMGVPYWMVIEEQERDRYARTIDSRRLVILDPEYQRDYDTCDDLGESKSKGPGPARNFAWDHAIDSGASWHWVMDDNIRHFVRLNHNRKIRCQTGSCLRAMEDFADRYSNVAMAGPNYRGFANQQSASLSFITNTRIYSCILIRNDIPYRWRARYNEDTDLSLRVLKDGWCTVQFNAFLQDKMVTQSMKGGNTDAFYAIEGTLAKSQMQVKLHPDVSRLVWKYGRWHHHVDYRPFKRNRLKLRDDVTIAEGVNDYGMRLTHVEAGIS